VCRERGLSVDEAGFHTAMDKQKAQARAAGKFKMDRALEYTGAAIPSLATRSWKRQPKSWRCTLKALRCSSSPPGRAGWWCWTARLSIPNPAARSATRARSWAAGPTLEWNDTQKIKSDVFGHHGTLTSGKLKVGDAVTAHVNTAVRAATQRNHSVTHLMHKALREVLGSHVQQKGSLVDAEKTRFDFAHNAPVTDAEIREIEKRVNEEILANAATQARVMDIESAQKTGAMMLFGEKYGETVRVLDIGTSANCAAARTCSAPATSACSRSWVKAVWPQGCAGSRLSLAPTRWPICKAWRAPWPKLQAR
jgi:alanyl-tRNA synthetase